MTRRRIFESEAEPLLLKGFAGMKLRQTSIPPGDTACLPKALDRLVELATAANKPDDVNKWKAERGKYPNPATAPEK